MTWRLAFLAVAAELRRRGNAVASANNAMVKCGSQTAEQADAKALIYRWISDELKQLATDPGKEALAKLRRWRAGS